MSVLVRKSCDHCGSPARLRLPDDGMKYFCPDSPECVSAKLDYQAGLRSATVVALRLEDGVRVFSPGSLFDLMEQQSIAQSAALERLVSRCSIWTVADELAAYRPPSKPVKKCCAVCGAEALRATYDDGQPYFCQETKCQSAKVAHWRKRRRLPRAS